MVSPSVHCKKSCKNRNFLAAGATEINHKITVFPVKLQVFSVLLVNLLSFSVIKYFFTHLKKHMKNLTKSTV